jgi:hypothetical protein
VSIAWRKLGELGPLTVLDNIDQVINSGERGVTPVDRSVIEESGHGQLGVTLEEGKSGVNLSPKLFLDLQFKGHKVFNKFVEIESNTVIRTQEDVEESTVALIVALQGNERFCHLRSSRDEGLQLIECGCNLPPMEHAVHHRPVSCLRIGLG